jgi:hypothetical protein
VCGQACLLACSIFGVVLKKIEYKRKNRTKIRTKKAKNAKKAPTNKR